MGLFAAVSLARGTQPQEIAARMASFPINEISLLIGLIMWTLGGWVAASIARRYALLHGAATGVLSLAMYWLMLGLMGSGTPAWYHAIVTVLTIPCAALGGYLRSRKPFTETGSTHGGSAPPIPEP
jgi:hypothetical protein